MLNQTEETLFSAGGIPLYAFPCPHLHSFSLSLFVRGGALCEGAEEAGVSHFIEHLVFRSINRRMGGTLYQTLDRLGLSVEGITYREFLQFSITGSPRRFAEAVSILSLALAPLSLSAEDIRTERSRIKAEIREEGERTSLDAFTDKILYEAGPLTRPITGTAGGLNRMSRVFLSTAWERLFTRENMFFYLSGAYPADGTAILLDALSPYTPASGGVRDNTVPQPKSYFHRDATVAVKHSDKTLLRLSFDIDTTRYSDAELTLLYDIVFGDGEECFFHRALSEQTGMIYSFRGYMELYRNLGTLGVSYEIPPTGILPSLSRAVGAIRRAKTDAHQALPFVRAAYTDNAAFLLDDAAALGFNRAYERYILSLPYRSLAERAEAYLKVTGERLCQVASEIFRPENATLTLKGRRVDTAAARQVLLTL